jgi:hypothetical protein
MIRVVDLIKCEAMQIIGKILYSFLACNGTMQSWSFLEVFLDLVIDTGPLLVLIPRICNGANCVICANL